jgi:hypothetical protein
MPKITIELTDEQIEKLKGKIIRLEYGENGCFNLVCEVTPTKPDHKCSKGDFYLCSKCRNPDCGLIAS